MEALEEIAVDGCGNILRVGDEVWAAGREEWKVDGFSESRSYVILTRGSEIASLLVEGVARKDAPDRPDRIPWIWP